MQSHKILVLFIPAKYIKITVDNILSFFYGRKPFQTSPNLLFGLFNNHLLKVLLNSVGTKLSGIIIFTGDYSYAMPSTLHPKSVTLPVTC